MEAKKIIITGGATRIGAAIAKSLANFDTKIAINYNKSKESAFKLTFMCFEKLLSSKFLRLSFSKTEALFIRQSKPFILLKASLINLCA